MTDDEFLRRLLALPPEVLAEFGIISAPTQPALKALGADPLSSPLSFALAHSRGQFIAYRWIRFLNDQIMEFLDSHDDLLFVTAPPRHGKSHFLSQWVPAWFICKFRLRVAVASYGDRFAQQWGRKVRDIMSDIGPQYGCFLREDSKAADRWDLHDQEFAGMFTAGAGGVITGKGFHLGIIDDPVKNRKEADSEIRREDAWDWWRGTWLSRREPIPPDNAEKAKLILLQTRWHFDDLGGRILVEDEENLAVRHLDLPAIAQDDDPMGREPGEALCPERYTVEDLVKQRKAVGARNWQALYQQTPGMDGGDYFKQSWFRSFSRDGDDYVGRARNGEEVFRVERRLVRKYQFLDTAYTRSKRADYTVLGTFGIVEADGVKHMLLLDIDRRQVESTQHSKMIWEGWQRHDPQYVGIEKTNASMSLLFEMQRAGLVVRELETKGEGKAARAETAAIAYETGRIWHPSWSPVWLEGFEKELLQFDKGAHDDQVDVVAYAARELLRGVLSQIRDRKVIPEHDGTNSHHIDTFRRKRHPKRVHPILGRF